MTRYDDDIKYYARALYLRKHTVPEIEEKTGIPRRTIYNWCDIESWHSILRHESVEDAIQRRLVLLAERNEKTEKDLNEMDRLIKQFNQISRVRQQQISNDKLRATPTSDMESPPDNNPDRKNRKTRKNRTVKNDVSQLKSGDFKKLHSNYFDYQHELYESYQQHRNRQFLKSRQIGFTWYFAQEALEDAILYGRNKIFLSATRAQAEIFRNYIVAISKEQWNIELKGNPIVLTTAHGPATLYFLSNSSLSAQGYHGDVYIDEFFWIRGFNSLYKVATGMAAHKKWRRTLFSTPSSVAHEAYDLWTGDRFLKRYKNRQKAPEFPDFKQLQNGMLCPDNTFRQIITLDDAERKGCDLFDKKELQLEYSPDEFRNLFMCEFANDTLSVFSFEKLEQCMVDTESWQDVDNSADRPVKNAPVWCGYDPSRHRDDASFVVLAPALDRNGKHRVIERFKWIGQSYTWQAKQIETICKRYNVQHIGIDVTGPGLGVLDLVKDFYPQATPIHYSPEIKSRLVLKTKAIIENNRLEYPADWTDVGHAFLTIRQTVTASGNMTYSAGRTNSTGHADIAWSIMHALDNEPLNPNGSNQSFVAIF